ncbi:MAG: hypothetical protein H6R22_960, partial [Chromatiaceae bacterium]|nr:hypothetical protein [Chromatiaceae bacterium]
MRLPGNHLKGVSAVGVGELREPLVAKAWG